ncbi:MAG: hypothetical protein V3W19_14290 [Desulfatiglandales bacterium]
MNNEELIQKAIEAGFDGTQCSRVTARDGYEAVRLPRNIEALTNLEEAVPTLKSVDREFTFHSWLVRA